MFETRAVPGAIERRGAPARPHCSRSAPASQPSWASAIALLALACAACTLQPATVESPPAPAVPPAVTPSTATPPPAATGAPPAAEPAIQTPRPADSAAPAAPEGAAYVPATFADLPGWRSDDQAAALAAFRLGCEALAARAPWREWCAAARAVPTSTPAAARRFFETHFRPYRALMQTGSDEGLITGYYEPLLRGSRTRSDRYRFPLYAVPDDLLVIDLSDVHPELKGRRVRGRLEGRRVIPYYSRAQIDAQPSPLNARVLYWVDDPVDLFFLQVQGSGQIRLDGGERVRIGYGDQNGYPYRSIGRYLIERGELAPDQASMQAIRQWARSNPDKLADVLHHNASYVFFRELPAGLPGPVGALGVPVSAGRSLAVDPQHVPLGAPVYLATTWPNTQRPLQRLMAAQDTGSAIRGPVRGDYFWGYGDQAGVQAGKMRQPGRMWVLLPSGVTPDQVLAR
jgi:membrane-bound lytic murein transglycosylase A